MIHVFEAAGLGRAPYRYIGLEKQHTGCQYCGTAIVFKFWLESADGKQFFVGSDCIFKSGDAGLRYQIEADVKKHQKELREERNVALLSQFTDYLATHPEFFTESGPFKGQPHPFSYYARQGRTFGNYCEYLWKHAGKSKKARLARQWLITVGAVLPARKTAKKAPVERKATVRARARSLHDLRPAPAPAPLPEPPKAAPAPEPMVDVRKKFLFKKIGK